MRIRNVVMVSILVVLVAAVIDFGILYMWPNYWEARLPWHTFSSKAPVILTIMHWDIIIKIAAIVAAAAAWIGIFKEAY